LKTKDEIELCPYAEESQNCASRGTMAQSKMKWRKFGDTFELKSVAGGRETLKE
jgi:hypothetical protein